MRGRVSSARGECEGSVAIEFAYVMPLLLVLCYGIYEIGHYLYERIDVSNAALDGARTGALYNGTSSVVVSTVDQDLTNAGLNASQATVTVCYDSPGSSVCNSGSDSSGNSVQVSVSIPYTYLMPGFTGVAAPHGAITVPVLPSTVSAQGQWVIPAPQT